MRTASAFSVRDRAACCMPSSRPDRFAPPRSPCRWHIPRRSDFVRHAEQVLGFALTERKIGGKGGGGSVLTDEAKEFLYRYEQYRDACKQAGKQLYPQFFPDEK